MIKTKLYKYQSQVIENALNDFNNKGFHALLLEMSMGKTLCTLRIFSEWLTQDLLVIPPKALYTTWKKEIAKHTNFDLVFFWENKKTIKYQKQVSRFLSENSRKIFIVNVESFQKKPQVFAKTPLLKVLKAFFKNRKILMAIDESTKIKGHNSHRTRNIIRVGRNAAYKLILTGAEIEHSILDLWSQYEFLCPDFWGRNYFQYRNRYMIKEYIRVAGGRLQDVYNKPQTNRMAELQERVMSCSSRLLKKDHLDLPDKIYEEIEIEPNKEQLKIYQQLKENMRAEYQGQLLTPTAQIALYTQFWQVAGGFMPGTGTLIGKSNPKLDFIVADSEGYSGPIVVWANFRAEVEYLVKALPDAAPYYGGQESGEREQILNNFEGGKIKYLVINPGSGSYGLNLQFCSLCYYFSNSNRPGFRRQGEDRFHRPGQQNHPTYKDLLHVDLGDKKRLDTLKAKGDFYDRFREPKSVKVFLDSV